MSESEREDFHQTPEGETPQAPQPSQAQAPIRYAGPVQRAWAWVGVAYMLLFLLTFTYFLATGRFLHSLGGLFIAPALLGLARTALVQYRDKRVRVPGLLCTLTIAVCVAFAVVGILSGLNGLKLNFGG